MPGWSRCARDSPSRSEEGTHAGETRLRYENQGRGGTVWYESQETRFGLWWEFAGGDALAIVEIPAEREWEKRTRLPLDRRLETLEFIGEQLVKDQTARGG